MKQHRFYGNQHEMSPKEKRIWYVKNVMAIIGLIYIVQWTAIGAYDYAKMTIHPNVVEAQIATSTPALPPMLVKICTSESGFKQFLPNGNVVRGKVDPSDIGICQINEPDNNDLARKMGYDIYTTQGNEAMALWMFDTEGTDPWDASKCIKNGWGNPADCK